MSAIYNLMESEYARKMLHKIPSAKVVDRYAFVERFRGKNILDIGSSGNMAEHLRKIANPTTVDRENADYCLNVERDDLPDGDFDYVFAGEILEHLSNAGMFLDKLQKYRCPIVITVPNAFSPNSGSKGIENVNAEHVAWYSYHTLKTLVERHGFFIDEFLWYNGKPYIAEGIIFVMRGKRWLS